MQNELLSSTQLKSHISNPPIGKTDVSVSQPRFNDIKERIRQNKQKRYAKDIIPPKHQSNRAKVHRTYRDIFINAVGCKGFLSESIIDAMEFKLKSILWDNLREYYINYKLINCIYSTIETCESLCISLKCLNLDIYCKMAEKGIDINEIEKEIKKDKHLTDQQCIAFINAYKLLSKPLNDYNEFIDEKDENNANKLANIDLSKYIKMEKAKVPSKNIKKQMKKDAIDDSIITIYSAINRIPTKNDLLKYNVSSFKRSKNKIKQFLSTRNIDINQNTDIMIALKFKEQFQTENIYKCIPIIMDAQSINNDINPLQKLIKQLLVGGETQNITIISYINKFKENCDINLLKLGLNLKLSSPSLSVFAPLNGDYAKYISKKESLPNTIKLIKKEELNRISEEIKSFIIKYIPTYYDKYYKINDNSEFESDFDLESESDLSFIHNTQWIYRILLSNSADCNFQCYSGGLSPLSYILTHNFDDLYIAHDLLTLGAKLQSKETYIMVNLYVTSSFKKNPQSYLKLCNRVCRKSNISLKNVIDINGNNPLHLIILQSIKHNNNNNKNQNQKIFIGNDAMSAMNSQENLDIFIKNKIKAIKLLYNTFPYWIQQKNHSYLYPLSLSIKLQYFASTICLGNICYSTKYIYYLLITLC